MTIKYCKIKYSIIIFIMISNIMIITNTNNDKVYNEYNHIKTSQSFQESDILNHIRINTYYNLPLDTEINQQSINYRAFDKENKTILVRYTDPTNIYIEMKYVRSVTFNIAGKAEITYLNGTIIERIDVQSINNEPIRINLTIEDEHLLFLFTSTFSDYTTQIPLFFEYRDSPTIYEILSQHVFIYVIIVGIIFFISFSLYKIPRKSENGVCKNKNFPHYRKGYCLYKTDYIKLEKKE